MIRRATPRNAAGGPIAAVLLLVCGVGCGTQSEDSPDEVVSDPVDTTAMTAWADSVAGRALDGTDSTAAPVVPVDRSTEEPSEPLLYQLLLINPTDSEAHVFASAGAGTVVVDTVPARDSIRVDLRLRAWTVELEADDGEGRSLGTGELQLDPTRLNRWVVPSNGR